MATAIVAAASQPTAETIDIEGIPFRKPNANHIPYKLRSISPNVHLVFGHNLYCGKEVVKRQIRDYKTAQKMYEDNLKNYPNYAYRPLQPTLTDEEFYQNALETLLAPLKGLVIATVASFPEQLRGGRVYKKFGFEIADQRCSWNPNYDACKPQIHWLHLFYKNLNWPDEAGEPSKTPDYETSTLNCCGAYLFVNEDIHDKPHNKMRLAFYDAAHKPEKRFIPIRQFKDFLVGVYPTTHKSRECPHDFDNPEANE